ncbi:50S ribosomal protein L2, partial [Candidatus Woesearchaeota archaeon]|nr:50S ribosomal protein L2 [Candidatus Woesearchaeota archaeon]
MGKNLIQQARGKGSPTYRAHSFRWKYTIGYRKYDEVEKTGFIKGRVVDIIDGPG